MSSSGIVIKSTGNWYNVKFDNGTIIQCRIKGKFRLHGQRLTNPVAVGDNVKVEMVSNEDNIGTIIDILPRTNYVLRQSPRKKHNVHLLASNIDQAMLIVTISNPKLKQGFIDRFLVMTEPYDIPVTIIFNKKDLYSAADLATYHMLRDLYLKIGYKTILVSAETGENIVEVDKLLSDKTTLIAGQSGVGKSTIINCLLPHKDLKTKELSDYTGKGQHTTTFAQMFDLPNGGHLVDTPGIKTLSFNHLEIMDVAHNFKEFFEFSSECKFKNCTHRNEPKCAVKVALESDEISFLRYSNYLQILDEIEDQNYWELHNDM